MHSQAGFSIHQRYLIELSLSFGWVFALLAIGIQIKFLFAALVGFQPGAIEQLIVVGVGSLVCVAMQSVTALFGVIGGCMQWRYFVPTGALVALLTVRYVAFGWLP